MAHYAGIMTGELSTRTRDLLTRYRRIAMVGVSGNPTRASYRALVHMRSKGYTVYPVNPGTEEILGLRCYRSLEDIGGAALVVSQFTLFADTRRGRRPGFTGAAPPELAERLYEGFCDALEALGRPVGRGRFGAEMAVELVNDGPFTIWLDSAG